MSERQIIHWESDEHGVVVLRIDDPKQTVNTMNDAFMESLADTVDRLEREREAIAGIIVTSSKPTFFAGGDLRQLLAVQRQDAAGFGERNRETKRHLRRLETIGVPVVAAINGSALGGGLEIALACHRRIVVDDPKLQLGFPEVTFGLLPGAGGIVRSVRLLGVVSALDELLLEGGKLTPRAALELGIVDELAPAGETLLQAARTWIGTRPEPAQPWDRQGYAIPGGVPTDPSLSPVVLRVPARLRKRLKGAAYPAPPAIAAAAVEGAEVDFDSALEIEGRYFVSLVTGQVSKNMIQGLFFDRRRASGERAITPRQESFVPKRAVVVGAGMMGAGIAYAFAQAGVEVVLKDVDLEVCARAKERSERLVAKAVSEGRTSEAEGRALLDRIHPTADPADAAGAEVLVEAVFEDPDVKAKAYSEMEPFVGKSALLASNTSTLPIGELADHVSRPSEFVGLHFFSPVERMPLLEIIAGRATTPETVGRALDIARLLHKTPILVNDSRGFFTSRVITPYLDEGIAMLGEGIAPASIERASLQAGFPAGVLQLADELNLNLSRRIREQNRLAAEAAGAGWEGNPAHGIVDRMLDEFGRSGRAHGAGFYEYEDGRRSRLWPGLGDAFPPAAGEAWPMRDLEERLLFIEAIEAVRCRAEGVIESVADANVGSVLGIGFPRWTGGVLQYVNGYEGSLSGFVERAHELSGLYGPRFEPPAMLVQMAARGETFSD